jgi:hypothetical protein
MGKKTSKAEERSLRNKKAGKHSVLRIHNRQGFVPTKQALVKPEDYADRNDLLAYLTPTDDKAVVVASFKQPKPIVKQIVAKAEKYVSKADRLDLEETFLSLEV